MKIAITNIVKKYFLHAIIAAVALFLGIMLGNDPEITWHEACHANYRFINADVVCDRTPVITKTGYAALQGRIEALLTAEVAAGHLAEAGVYFRDLEDGPVFGVNETADFAPASLLKLPLALVYLTQAERRPEILKQELSVAKPQWSFTQTFESKVSIDPKEPHKVKELLMHMLAHSDNDSYGVLLTHLHETGQKELITATFLELGFINPNDINDAVLSVRRYGGIFRALYNASYVSPALSEMTLAWRAQSNFTEGLRGGVPEEVAIAHKFGGRFTEDGKKQLHDCGIVYYPANPYLICIMSKGDDFGELATVITRISAEVYREVDSRRIK